MRSVRSIRTVRIFRIVSWHCSKWWKLATGLVVFQCIRSQAPHLAALAVCFKLMLVSWMHVAGVPGQFWLQVTHAICVGVCCKERHRQALQLPPQLPQMVASTSKKVTRIKHNLPSPPSSGTLTHVQDGALPPDGQSMAPPWKDASRSQDNPGLAPESQSVEHSSAGTVNEALQLEFAFGESARAPDHYSEDGSAAQAPEIQAWAKPSDGYAKAETTTAGTGPAGSAESPESSSLEVGLSPEADTQDDGESSDPTDGESYDLGYDQSYTSVGVTKTEGFFHILPNSVFGDSQKYFWKPFPEVSRTPACFVEALEAHPSRVQDPADASFLVVPMYRIAHVLNNGNWSDIATVLTDLRRNLNSSRSYINYGGARHVFVYPQSTSKSLMALLQATLDVDLYSFWAAPGRRPRKNWRCPHRFVPISVSKEDADCESTGRALSALAKTTGEDKTYLQLCDDGSFWCKRDVEAMLGEVLLRVQGREVWECHGLSLPTSIAHDRFLSNRDLNRMRAHTFIDEQHQTLSCFMPKCASTVLKMMQKRQTGVDSWQATDEKGRAQGLVHFAADASTEEYHAIVDDPRWVKFAVVRDPVIRCLSGYLHKIVQLKQNYYVHWKGKGRPTFEEFVDILFAYPAIRGNHHFLEQSAMCGHRVVHYNFIAHVETLHDDYKELFGRLGLWQSIGESGWGDDGTQSFLQAFQPSANHPSQLESSTGDAAVAAHYTMDMLEKVYLMYREDFDRFGYSIDKWRRLVAHNGANQ
ncbi:unnamed protein product [Ostreobium quekettii]|uniref:Uncharacterized protein n=1 Tax=Ostreobium quekettii TaxID=121088 RepID=A0A8S1IUE9_9CHLO|nr:unnamed protein product [Ostreobium quekettii]|eukprot:evm.model.scf_3855.1 EVM.evm.TU.scf_3855.1   scf_3855:4656-7996(-)